LSTAAVHLYLSGNGSVAGVRNHKKQSSRFETLRTWIRAILEFKSWIRFEQVDGMEVIGRPPQIAVTAENGEAV
jgi:hypothetical protein